MNVGELNKIHTKVVIININISKSLNFDILIIEEYIMNPLSLLKFIVYYNS